LTIDYHDLSRAGQLTHADALRLVAEAKTTEAVMVYGRAVSCSPMTMEWVASVRKLLPILGPSPAVEVGAGKGVLASLLGESLLIGTEPNPFHLGIRIEHLRELAWQEALKLVPEGGVLLSCWPVLYHENDWLNLPDKVFPLRPDITLVLHAPRTEAYLGTWMGREKPASEFLEGFQDPPGWATDTASWGTCCTMVLNGRQEKNG